MKKYQAQFELKDRMSQSKASKEMVEKRRKMKADFDSWKAGAREEYEANKVREPKKCVGGGSVAVATGNGRVWVLCHVE